jgi:hypothetical protein
MTHLPSVGKNFRSGPIIACRQEIYKNYYSEGSGKIGFPDFLKNASEYDRIRPNAVLSLEEFP